MMELGYTFFVIETKCRHSFPLRYGDKFRVTAKLIDYDNRVNISYEIFNLSEERRSARGKSVLVTTDMQGNLLLETPEVVRSRLVES